MVLLQIAVAAAASVVSFLLLVMRWPSIRTIRLVNRIHGPPGFSIIGIAHSLAFMKMTELIDFLKGVTEKYPRFCRMWVMGMPGVIMQEPDDLEVLLGSVNHITKGLEYNSVIQWLQEGLLTSTGQKWHTRRKMLTNAFHFKILEDALPNFNKNGVLLAQKLLGKKDDPLIAESYIKNCTLDVICETAMGVQLGAQNNQADDYIRSIQRANEIIVKRVITVWLHHDWLFYITHIGFEFRKLLKSLHNFTESVINDRRVDFLRSRGDPSYNQKKRKAFLDTLLEVEQCNPQLLNHSDIREEVDTFMFEGHDTTTAAIVFSLFMLGLHPHIQEKVGEEMFEIFGYSDRSVEKKDLQQMVYLEKVIKETLRLFPSVPYISRLLTQDLLLGGDVLLPSGSNVMIVPYLLHRNPRLYHDPETFDPERFSEEASHDRHPFAYIPFSAGPRNCIGQKFALMEMKVILSWILRKTEVTSVTKMEELKFLPLMILRTNIPIKLKFKPKVMEPVNLST